MKLVILSAKGGRYCASCNTHIKYNELFWQASSYRNRYGGACYTSLCLKCIVKTALQIPNFRKIKQIIIAEKI